MEKREKIIVVATLIASLYGAVDFLFLSKKAADLPPSSPNNQELLSNVAVKLTNQTHRENDKVQQLVKQINTPWPQKVFRETSSVTKKEKPADDINLKKIEAQFSPAMFVYSGFLAMGSNKMAIINGTDYKLGDKVNGFTLVEISPKYIKVAMKKIPFQVEIKQPIKP